MPSEASNVSKEPNKSGWGRGSTPAPVEGQSPAVPSPQSELDKKAYRYAVKESGGSMAHLAPGTFICDWTYFGRSHTWNIYKTPEFEPVGWFSGVYCDKGVIRDGKYMTDAELAAA